MRDCELGSMAGSVAAHAMWLSSFGLKLSSLPNEANWSWLWQQFGFRNSPGIQDRHCARHGDSADALAYCTIMPIPCDAAGDCPAYRVDVPDGSQGEWTCEAGVCHNPGVEYATR
jgi:hypothetical protein